MAQPLSFLFQVNTSGNDHVHALNSAFTSQGGPNILHYAWAVPLPAATAPPGNWVLLSTVYDENFESYIADLVNANPALFNNAAKHIVGMENFVLPKDLSPFTAFILAHDLTGGGQTPSFFEDYPYTCVQIDAALG